MQVNPFLVNTLYLMNRVSEVFDVFAVLFLI